jgi:long-chain fatty acid transport protein
LVLVDKLYRYGVGELSMPKNLTSKKILGIVVVSVLTGMSQVNAASFQVKEQNVTNLGTAYAGTATLAEDASTGSYNPAGLTNLEQDNLVLSAVGMKARIKLNVTSATTNLGAPYLGSTGDVKPKGKALLPSMHIAKRFNDAFVGSFNITTPFGLKTEYESGSIAGLMATRSEVRTINVSPSLGYKVNDKLSVGAGLDAIRAEAWLYGDCYFASLGTQDNHAKGWAYGYHVGILYRVSEAMRMGLAYHSRFSVRGKGESKSTSIPQTPVDRTLTAKVNLPDRLVYSIHHDYSDRWSMMADVEWVHWKRFDELRLDFSNSTSHIKPEYNKNSYRIALGGIYKSTDAWQFKGGVAFDKSPAREDTRTARIPDSDRFWIALGGKYKINRCFSVDAGYAHLFFKNAKIAESTPNGGKATGNANSLNGTYKSHADIVGIQLTWNFV